MDYEIKIPTTCALVVGGKWHDMAYARGELTQALQRHAGVTVRSLPDYADIALIEAAPLLVTYTCDLVPPPDVQQRLRARVERGGRWLALHGTNSILQFLDDGRVDTPDEAPGFMDTLGSRFLAHPPIARYTVAPTARASWLTQGVEPFEVEDELYLAQVLAPIRTLLDVGFEGQTPRFTTDCWAAARHPVLYERRLGLGSVLYCTLGHCRGPHDMRPLMDVYPRVERGAWDSPVYRDLLDRCIAWGLGSRPACDDGD